MRTQAIKNQLWPCNFQQVINSKSAAMQLKWKTNEVESRAEAVRPNHNEHEGPLQMHLLRMFWKGSGKGQSPMKASMLAPNLSQIARPRAAMDLT